MLGFILVHHTSFAAGSFYEGKTIRIVVGFSAIVENMTGAGSLIPANYLYRIAKPDGLTIGHFVGNLFISQLLEQQGIEFDARKFKYIGALAKENAVCILNKKSGIPSVDKWKTSGKVLKLGGLGPNSILDQVIRVLKAALGLPLAINLAKTDEGRATIKRREGDGGYDRHICRHKSGGRSGGTNLYG